MHIWDMTKRNHGLEHATIALLLNDESPDKPFAGYSIPSGFVVLGPLETDRVHETALAALQRMKDGEAGLAISPFCGTNIVVGAALATAGTLLGYHAAGRGLRGVNRAFSNATLAIVASRPLGRLVQQRFTTSADVGGMTIEEVTRYDLGRLTVHWVETGFAD